MATVSLGIHKPGFWFYHHFWTAVDWVFPPTCAGCQKFGDRWCPDCQAKTQRLSGSICPRCGAPASKGENCDRCRLEPLPFEAVRSWGLYSGPLREAIHKLKYKHDIGIAEALSIHLIELFDRLGWPVDILTVVPLSPERIRERGYNQSDLLAYPLSLARGIPFRSDAVTRVRDTLSQVGLSARERKENVRAAFLARNDRVADKSVLLMDDVMTTGSTLTACAQAIIAGGAKKVYGLTIARAVLVSEISGEGSAALADA